MISLGREWKRRLMKEQIKKTKEAGCKSSKTVERLKRDVCWEEKPKR